MLVITPEGGKDVPCKTGRGRAMGEERQSGAAGGGAIETIRGENSPSKRKLDLRR